jgi:hypothetical protein
LEIFSSKKINYTMENNPKRNIYYTFCHIIFFFNLQKVLLLRLGLFSILYLIFFEEKISNNANLFIYFRGYC